MIENRYTTEQARWEAIVQRDWKANGSFVYGVLTTAIYCCPACSSRQPKAENVRYFDTWEQAEKAGFRACKRCRPNSSHVVDEHRTMVLKACAMITAGDGSLRLKEIAGEVGLSPFHFQRLFKKLIGITPKQYAMQTRLNRVRNNLRADSAVTDAIYEAGFASSSRFYENVDQALGMMPSQYRKGADGVFIRWTVAPSNLGWVLIAATVKGICAIDIGDNPDVLKERLRKRFPKADIQDPDQDMSAWVAQVMAYLREPQQPLDLPLDIQGTAFQRKVWMALRDIPPGKMQSYAQIAERIGAPLAARAVAQACASNQIALAIPCHRVVRKDGALGGYRWGVERKRALLEGEAVKKSY